MEIPFSALSDSQLTDYDTHMNEVVSGHLPVAALAASIWTHVRQEMVNRGLTTKVNSIVVEMTTIANAALSEYDADMHAAHAKNLLRFGKHRMDGCLGRNGQAQDLNLNISAKWR